MGAYKNANSKQTLNSHSLEKLFVAFFCKFCCDNRDLQSFLKNTRKSSRGTPFSRAVNLMKKMSQTHGAGTEIYSILGLA